MRAACGRIVSGRNGRVNKSYMATNVIEICIKWRYRHENDRACRYWHPPKSCGKKKRNQLFRKWCNSQDISLEEIVYATVNVTREKWLAKIGNVHTNKAHSLREFTAPKIVIEEDRVNYQCSSGSLGHSKHRQVPRRAHKAKAIDHGCG